MKKQLFFLNFCHSQISFILLIFFTAGVLHASMAKNKVILQLKWMHQFQFAGYYAAIKEGYYKKEGLYVVLKEGGPRINPVDEVVKGHADYGIDDSSILLKRLNGKAIVVLAAIFQKSPLVFISVKPDIRKAEDMKDKRIMINTNRVLSLWLLLHKHGIYKKDFKRIPYRYSDTLHIKKYDVTLGYMTDLPYFLEQHHIPYHIINPKDSGIDFYGDCLFTSQKEIEKHPQRVAAFRRASLRGWQYAMEHPLTIINYIKNNYHSRHSNEELLYEAVRMQELILPSIVKIGYMSSQRWNHILATYRKEGMAKAKKIPRGFIFKSHISEKYPLLLGILIGLLTTILLTYLVNRGLHRMIKNATVEIRKQEFLFRSIFEYSLDGILLIGSDGLIQNANPAAASILGYKTEDLVGHSFMNLIPPDKRKKHIERLNNFKKSNMQMKEILLTVPALKKDGSQLTIEAVTNHLRINNDLSILFVFRDISERLQADRKLTESERNYREIFNSINDAVFIHDAENGKILDVNYAMLEMYRCSYEEALDLPVGHPELSTSMHALEKIHKADREGPQVFEWEAKRQDETVFPAEVSLRAANINGHRRIIAVVRDLSERKKLETQLRQSQKMEAIGTLAGGIAHDFNNILAAILGFAELGIIKSKETTIKEYLEQIRSASMRARDLVRQILTFSRNSTPEKKLISITPLIKESLALLRSSIPKDIKIVEEIHSNSHIEADATQIQQVIMNLCTNAYQSMQQTGGSITVTADDLYISADEATLPAGAYVRLSVGDTGHGIDEETLHRIFDPFFTTKAQNQGTGLGLSVVHGIVKNHKGAITVNSMPGKGSEFNVFLPIVETENNENTLQTENPESMSKSHARVLLVDDETMITQVISEYLAYEGYRVETFNKPLEALNAFGNKPFDYDIVISDLSMPEMSGKDLFFRIHAIREDVPFILCSGFSETVNKSQLIEQGVSAFLLKPLSIQNLISKIERLTQPKS